MYLHHLFLFTYYTALELNNIIVCSALWLEDAYYFLRWTFLLFHNALADICARTCICVPGEDKVNHRKTIVCA